MSEPWMRESITNLKEAIAKFNQKREGNYRQSLIIADGATETLMRNFLIFKCNSTPPFNFHSLLQNACGKVNVTPDDSELISNFHLIRNGFYHQNIKEIEKALKGTTTGLTLEKSFMEDYLKTICRMFKALTGTDIQI